MGRDRVGVVGLSRASRREYTKAMRARYLAAGRRERSELLDEMVLVAGYTRKHAITLLNQPEPLTPRVARKRSGRPREYRHSLPAIELAWEALDYCCAQRLHPQLVPLTECLARHGELKLTLEARSELRRMSRATLARRLAEMPVRKPKQVPALCVEQSEEWLSGRKYLDMELLDNPVASTPTSSEEVGLAA